MAAVALGERSINAAPTPPRRGARGKAALGSYRVAPSSRLPDVENGVRTPPSTRGGGAPVDDSPGIGMARFDSLQDLLQKAGYKETRVFTPISTAHASGQGSPPSSGPSARDALKGKASTLGRKAGAGMQEAAEPSRRNTSSMGKAAGAWFAAVWGATTAAARDEPPAVPALPPALASSNTTPPPATSAAALKSVQQCLATRSSRGELRQAASSPPTTAIVHDPAPSATSTSSPVLQRSTTSARSSPRRVHVAASSPGRSPRKRLVALPRRSSAASGSPTGSAGRNTLWSASLRYRAANNSAGRGAASRSVPARNAALVGTQGGVRLAGGRNKMRRSLVDAFGDAAEGPTKAGAAEEQDDEEQGEGEERTKGSDAAEMRRLRKERREWRESISSLKAFAASTSASSSSAKDKTVLPPSSLSRSSSPTSEGSPTKSRSHGGAPLSDLFARAAAPLVSRDDAVVLRSADCLWPAGGTGLRRMRSVEALERAVASLRAGTSGSIDATVALANAPSSAAVAPRNPKSPEAIRAPPALMLTSPTGQSGAQLIDLGAQEFEPRSLSPEQLRAMSVVRAPTKPKRSMIPKRNGGIYRAEVAASEEEGASSSASSTSGKRGRKRMPKPPAPPAEVAAPAEPSLMAPRPAPPQRGRKQRNRSKSSASSSSSAEEAPAAGVAKETGSHRINALRQQPRPPQNVADDPFVVAPSAAAPAPAASTGRGNVQRNAAKARRAAESSTAAPASPSKSTLSRSSGRTALAKSSAQAPLTMSPETVRAAYGANTDSPSVALAKRSKSQGESRIPVASP